MPGEVFGLNPNAQMRNRSKVANAAPWTGGRQFGRPPAALLPQIGGTLAGDDLTGFSKKYLQTCLQDVILMGRRHGTYGHAFEVQLLSWAARSTE
jgi:hypothetical protein